jgi:GrpB-like predicted nucleotidyltransferase (UPF0157 family)
MLEINEEIINHRLIENLSKLQILVEVVPYNENWPHLFEEEATKIRQVLGNQCVAIYHIGSTSVPGLAAKPVIDMIPVVKDVFQVSECRAAMEAQGYEARGICSFTFEYLFKKDAPYPACHVHIFGERNPEIDFNLRFRDYLRTHDHERDAYAALKLNLAQKHPHDMLSYCLGKSNFFKEIHTKAQFEKMLSNFEKG